MQIPTSKEQHNRESVAFAPGVDGFYTISENGTNNDGTTKPRPVKYYAQGVNTPSGQDTITAGSGDIIRELLVNLTDDGNTANPRPGSLRRAIEFAER